MNKEEAGSQDSTLPAKKLFKRRLKRVADDDSDYNDGNKENLGNRASAKPPGKIDIEGQDLNSEGNNAEVKTGLGSKEQPLNQNVMDEDDEPKGFELKRLRRRTLKKTYNEESERSNIGPNS